uniref:Uncharacterized protein n=1 Tax=Gibberella zeae TaxID=5518 RepID=A0A4E9DEP2_GIBZA
MDLTGKGLTLYIPDPSRHKTQTLTQRDPAFSSTNLVRVKQWPWSGKDKGEANHSSRQPPSLHLPGPASLV